MLIKRIANSSSELLDYCKKAGLLFKRRINNWVLFHQISKDERCSKMIEMMIGPYMGANVIKDRHLMVVGSYS